MNKEFTSAVADLQGTAERLLAAPVLTNPDSRGRIVSQAADLKTHVERVIATAIDQERRNGASWKEIGDALGVSRQAAFQRYGKPIDPRTGAPMNTTPLPEATTLAGTVIEELAAGQWSTVTSRFDTTMASDLSEEALAAAWTQVIGQAGAYTGHDEPEASRAADDTVTDTTVHFEAADFIAKITFHDDKTIAGLFILDPKMT